MFGLDITVIAFLGLLMLATGGLIFFLMFDRVTNEARQERRVKSIQNRQDIVRSRAAERIAETARRKKSVQDSLKELEQKQREKTSRSVGLRKQIQQAGLKLNLRQFFILSLICGVLLAVVAYVLGAPYYIVGAAALVGALGFPRWMVSRLRRRRMNKFLDEFPNAVDVVVRGVKAGLPLNDCLAIIAREAREPVSTEFRRIIEAQQMGMPLSEAALKLYDNMPLAESNFFAIVIAIQQSAGGNLSEALGNLSNVLRDRKKMKGKIQAMSAEAKASGAIIGALPFIVMLLVYLTTPDYIKILFIDPTGNIILICAGIWMTIGILVMKKMINFDF
ncbi:MAG: pilus assembly protein [Alphaproteobacteria bacterium]|nr:MAG: pilus assembly protein [Alphaproteobacteria bacterium]